MTWFTILAPIFIFALWYFCRKVLKNYFLTPFNLSTKFLYPLDFLVLAPLVLRFMYRIKPELYTSFIGTLVGINYILLGVSWIVVSYGILFFFLEKKWKKNESKYNPSRRLFLKKNLAYSGYGVIGAVSTVGAYQAYNPEIEKVSVPLKEKDKALSGFKITQISDLHIGASIGKSFIEYVVEECNKLDSDIVVITGDIADGTPEALADDLEPLKNLKSRQGIYYVNGNHEFYWGIDAWMEYLPKLGFEVLDNRNKIITFNNTPICIAGTNDFIAPRFSKKYKFDPKAALGAIDREIYSIMLTHRPRSFPYTHPLNINLQLSGHTHGGQAYPWNIITKFVQPYLAGLYDHDGMWIYVNRGTGFWGPPNRMGVGSEITQLTLG